MITFIKKFYLGCSSYECRNGHPSNYHTMTMSQQLARDARRKTVECATKGGDLADYDKL